MSEVPPVLVKAVRGLELDVQRDPHLAHPEGCAALRIVLVAVPRVSRSCKHFPDGFNLHFLQFRREASKGWAEEERRLPKEGAGIEEREEERIAHPCLPLHIMVTRRRCTFFLSTAQKFCRGVTTLDRLRFISVRLSATWR